MTSVSYRFRSARWPQHQPRTDWSLLARHFSAPKRLAYLLALLWVSFPILWGNTGFSMLAIGFSLLPFYIYVALLVFSSDNSSILRSAVTYTSYAFVVLIAVFMDGYSFMMFAVSSSLLGSYSIFAMHKLPVYSRIARNAFHYACFLFAVYLYTEYAGASDFFNHSIDRFRGEGIDLSFLLIPTTGIHWFFDLVGLNTTRNSSLYFSHFSSWTTTFSLPIILLGLFCWWKIKATRPIASIIVLLMVFGFHMAMGPSVKFFSTKYPEDKNLPAYSMPAERALLPSGNSYIYENLPGFKQMRLTFRWAALGIFCSWLLFVLFASGQKSSRQQFMVSLVAALLILLNLPHFKYQNIKFSKNREMFLSIEQDLIEPLMNFVEKGEKVLFLPYRNDWLLGYVASKSRINSFNIGGDKNLKIAYKHWPKSIRHLRREALTYPQLLRPLEENDTDIVVVTYFNGLTSSFHWPCTGSFKCPDDYRSEHSDTVDKVKALGKYEVIETDLFVIIRDKQMN